LLSSGSLLRILFKLWQRRIHFVPWLSVTCPHVHLRFEPAGIIQAGGSNSDKFRNCIGLDHDRRATIRAKASAGHAAPFAGRRMKAGRALQDLESFSRYDDERRKRGAGRLLAIATVAVKHRNRGGNGLIADGATGASTGERTCCTHSWSETSAGVVEGESNKYVGGRERDRSKGVSQQNC
jgi:hypothetical protein